MIRDCKLSINYVLEIVDAVFIEIKLYVQNIIESKK